MDFDSFLLEEDLSSLFDIKYAAGGHFLINFPADLGRDLPMFIQVLEYLIGSYGALEPVHRAAIKDVVKKRLDGIKGNQLIIKVPKYDGYSHIFLRGFIFDRLRETLVNLVDSFFVPLTQIPLLINQKSTSVHQYVYKCRLEGVLPLTKVNKDNFTPCIILRNF